jgi:CheY-like chemotaxis protein
LVVDDAPTVRELVALTFPGNGWYLDFATSGAEAIKLVRQATPDVVLMSLVLPDMHAVKLCELFAKDPRTARVPIVVMSAKGRAASEVFRNFESFAACIGKPASPALIRAEVEAAIARRQPARRATEVPPSSARKEAAMKAVYSLLRDALTHVPRWMEELGDAAPAAYFARKMLTPELVSRLVDALAPHLDEPASARHILVDGASFQANFKGWLALDLLTFFETSARTGELTLTYEGKAIVAYLKAGEVVLVTNRDPLEYLRGGPPSAARLAGTPRELLRAAENEQRVSATPVFVTLAARGLFPVHELEEVLGTHGRRLLLDAVDASTGKCLWREMSVLPAYVRAHGRPMSTARNVLASGAAPAGDTTTISLEQMLLDRLRESEPETLPAGDTVFARAAGFAGKVRAFELSENELRALSLVDGQATATEIGNQCRAGMMETIAILARLCEVGLLRAASSAGQARTSTSSLQSVAQTPSTSERAPGRRPG